MDSEFWGSVIFGLGQMGYLGTNSSQFWIHSKDCFLNFAQSLVFAKKILFSFFSPGSFASSYLFLYIYKKSHWLQVSGSCQIKSGNTKMSSGCFEQNLQVKNEKSKHRHWILRHWISLDTKFQLKVVILFFGPNLHKKDISGGKRKNWKSSF